MLIHTLFIGQKKMHSSVYVRLHLSIIVTESFLYHNPQTTRLYIPSNGENDLILRVGVGVIEDEDKYDTHTHTLIFNKVDLSLSPPSFGSDLSNEQLAEHAFPFQSKTTLCPIPFRDSPVSPTIICPFSFLSLCTKMNLFC